MPEGGLQSNSTGLMNKLPPINSSSGGITESQLLQMDKITPEDVKRLNCITEGEYFYSELLSTRRERLKSALYLRLKKRRVF